MVLWCVGHSEFSGGMSLHGHSLCLTVTVPQACCVSGDTVNEVLSNVSLLPVSSISTEARLGLSEYDHTVLPYFSKSCLSLTV